MWDLERIEVMNIFKFTALLALMQARKSLGARYDYWIKLFHQFLQSSRKIFSVFDWLILNDASQIKQGLN